MARQRGAVLLLLTSLSIVIFNAQGSSEGPEILAEIESYDDDGVCMSFRSTIEIQETSGEHRLWVPSSYTSDGDCYPASASEPAYIEFVWDGGNYTMDILISINTAIDRPTFKVAQILYYEGDDLYVGNPSGIIGVVDGQINCTDPSSITLKKRASTSETTTTEATTTDVTTTETSTTNGTTTEVSTTNVTTTETSTTNATTTEAISLEKANANYLQHELTRSRYEALNSNVAFIMRAESSTYNTAATPSKLLLKFRNFSLTYFKNTELSAPIEVDGCRYVPNLTLLIAISGGVAGIVVISALAVALRLCS